MKNQLWILILLLSVPLFACSSGDISSGDSLLEQAQKEYPPSAIYNYLSSHNFDSDGDGIPDHIDPCPATPDDDADGDGICEKLLGDINGDGCVNLADQSILAEEYGKSGYGLQSDLVPDGIVNLIDVAVFSQTIGQCQDNCPTTPNPDQLDSNNNYIGDACEIITCESNFCHDRELTSGFHCDGSSSVECSVDANGCGVVKSKITCSSGICENSGMTAGLCQERAVPVGSPSISSIAPSSATRATLSGSSFGTHSMEIEHTSDWIENQPDGVNPNTKDRWSHALSGFQSVDKISSVRAWSGQKSVHTKTDASDKTCGGYGCYSSTLMYSHPQPFQRIYATFWMYTDFKEPSNLGNTQWKFIRLNSGKNLPSLPKPGTSVTPIDNPQGEIYWPMFVNGSGNYAFSQVAVHCETECSGSTVTRPCMENGMPVGYGIAGGRNNPPTGYDYWWKTVTRGIEDGKFYADFAPTKREWTRVEIYGYSGTEGNADGTFRLSVIKPGVGKRTGFEWDGINFFSTKDCRNEWQPWQALVFQNMFDDNGGAYPSEKADFFFDDYYIQIGTEARIEIGNQPNYADSTLLEVQRPISWTDSSIEFVVNPGGSFNSGDRVYVFVVRADGSVSNSVEYVIP